MKLCVAVISRGLLDHKDQEEILEYEVQLEIQDLMVQMG